MAEVRTPDIDAIRDLCASFAKTAQAGCCGTASRGESSGAKEEAAGETFDTEAIREAMRGMCASFAEAKREAGYCGPATREA